MSEADREIVFFITWCIEQYKAAHQLDGEEVMNIFDNRGVLDFLEKNYDVLHTQSPQWIIEEITDVISGKEQEV